MPPPPDCPHRCPSIHCPRHPYHRSRNSSHTTHSQPTRSPPYCCKVPLCTCMDTRSHESCILYCPCLRSIRSPPAHSAPARYPDGCPSPSSANERHSRPVVLEGRRTRCSAPYGSAAGAPTGGHPPSSF